VNITGSVAFVTGANRGLGRALAEALLRRGAAKVYAGIRNTDGDTPAGTVPVKIDVTDEELVRIAAARCGDVTLLINNAGVARVEESALDPALIDHARTVFEANFYGMIRTSQAFAPILRTNGGGAIVNILSDATWFARSVLTAYSASKSAAWAFTNALRVDLRKQGTQVLALHVGFMDTDMSGRVDIKKHDPALVATRTFDALEAGDEELLADDQSEIVKRSLSTKQGYYLDPPPIG